MIPGNPTPTATISSPFCTCTTCSSIRSRISSAGISSSESASLVAFGKYLIDPLMRFSSTSAAAMCSAAKTPIARDIDAIPLKRFLREPCKLVQPVESSRFIALGESRIVEYGIDEVIDRALETHDCLADVK